MSLHFIIRNLRQNILKNIQVRLDRIQDITHAKLLPNIHDRSKSYIYGLLPLTQMHGQSQVIFRLTLRK